MIQPIIKNPISKIRPQKRGHKLTALSLLSLHSTVYTLTGTLLSWTLPTQFLRANALKYQVSPLVISQKSPSDAANSVPLRELIITPVTPVNSANPLQPPIEQSLPSQTNPSLQFKIYRLGIGDIISVNVQKFPDLSFQSNIDVEGNIIIPLVGKMPLVGLTLEEAKEKIRLALDRYVIEPQVTVLLTGQRPAQVTIIGEVSRPGFYSLQTGSQLTAALLTAGGATTSADLRSVLVRRALIDGAVIEQKIDLFTPLQNGQPLPDLRLQDGDSVIIPKIEVGTTKDYDRTLVSRSSLAQAQINVRVLSYAAGGIGNLALPNGSTFVDALTAISPSADNANLREIALIRFDPEQGKAVTQKLDGKKALLGDISQNVPLQNHDVIVVGRSLIAKIGYALNIFTQPFRDVLGFTLFFDSLRKNASNLFGPTSR